MDEVSESRCRRLVYMQGVQVTAIISALGTLTLAIYGCRALRNARSGPSADAHADQQLGAEPEPTTV
jgi:hypothetical protein